MPTALLNALSGSIGLSAVIAIVCGFAASYPFMPKVPRVILLVACGVFALLAIFFAIAVTWLPVILLA